MSLPDSNLWAKIRLRRTFAGKFQAITASFPINRRSQPARRRWIVSVVARRHSNSLDRLTLP